MLFHSHLLKMMLLIVKSGQGFMTPLSVILYIEISYNCIYKYTVKYLHREQHIEDLAFVVQLKNAFE